jgi:hypothetical protein
MVGTGLKGFRSSPRATEFKRETISKDAKKRKRPSGSFPRASFARDLGLCLKKKKGQVEPFLGGSLTVGMIARLVFLSSGFSACGFSACRVNK